MSSTRHPFYPDLKQRLSLKVFEKYIDVQSKLHDLTYLFWECTVRCNVSCLHCGSDCRVEEKVKDMPAEDFLKVTAEVRRHYNPNKVMIIITGGEPLMRKDLEDVGFELYKQGYPWGMVTNGYVLTEERFKRLLKAGLRSATVSLDGLESNHNWLRGRKTSYNKAIDAIKMIVKTPDIVFDVVTCANSRNIEELPQIKVLLQSMGVRLWRIFTVSPIGRAKDDKELQITDVQFLNLMNFIKSTRKENKVLASYGCEGFLGSFEGEVRNGYYFCRAGINIASVLNDGSISACPNNSSNVVQGNIYKDDFMDVWNNRFHIMRNRNWTKQGLCESCDVFKWCRGNGLHLHDFENNTVMKCHYKILKDAYPI